MKQSVWNKKKIAFLFEIICIFILILYPLRHVTWGLDLWDTGYNYGNFRFLGEGYLDPMWFFSTYLANVTGHFLTLLPFGDTLIGMNVYTGLQVSILAVMGYVFASYTLRIPKPLVFFGELLAVSLCWCPTALLYNYLTYIFFLGAVILLYKGLTREKRVPLFVAGILLATNIFVRFSNLPEAGLILAVWGYDVLDSIEQKKKMFTRTWRDTLACLGGYLSGVAVWFLWIALRYGIGEYGNAISRLFSMTDSAADYSPVSMLRGIIIPYVNMLYWVIRIAVFVVAAILLMFGVRYLSGRILRKQRVLQVCFVWIGRLGFAGIISGLFVWLYRNKFCSFRLYSYDAMLMPAILCMFFLFAVAFVRIIQRGVPKEEKLLSILVILILLLTPIGSNNGLYPAINNWFVAAPYLLWELYRFTLRAFGKKKEGEGKAALASYVSMAVAAWCVCLFCVVHFLAFGMVFHFAEATGVRDISCQVTDNKVLKGVRMSKEKAALLQELTDYVHENRLHEKEIFLFGRIPAMAYYLDMTPAFNTWSDLDSFAGAVMEEELGKLSAGIHEGTRDLPVILAGNEGINENNPKWNMIAAFLEEHGYRRDFTNDSVTLWITEER